MRYVRIFLTVFLPIAAVTFAVLRNTDLAEPWMDWGFAVALSGLVGFGTNWLAIRMLFRPKQPTCFGAWRQGLLPRNQAEMGEKVGEAIKTQLLSPETIARYIEHEKVIEKSLVEAGELLKASIADEETRRKIHRLLIRTYNENAEAVFDFLIDRFDAMVLSFFENDFKVEDFWESARPRVEEFLRNVRTREDITSRVIEKLAEHSGEIARFLSEKVRDSLAEERRRATGIEWVGASIKEFIGKTAVTPERTQKLLTDMARNRSFHEELLRFLDAHTDEISGFLERNRDTLARVHDWLKDYARTLGKEKIVPGIRSKVDGWLVREASWEQVDVLLHKGLLRAVEMIPSWAEDPEVVRAIQRMVPGLLSHVDLKTMVARVIRSKDPEEFETLVREATDKHLAAIEVFGGFLGMLAGLALMDVRFLFGVPAAVLVFLGIEKVFPSRGEEVKSVS